MNLDVAVGMYLDSLRTGEKHTKSTIQTYQSYLRAFVRWLEETGLDTPTVDHMTPCKLQGYLDFLRTKRNPNKKLCSFTTVRGFFGAVRGFSTYLCEQGFVEVNHAANINLPKRKPVTGKLVTDKEVESLLSASRLFMSPAKASLSHAIFSTLIWGAVGRQELLDIRVGNVDVATSSLTINPGAGKRPRTIVLPNEWRESIKEWLSHRETIAPNHDYLFSYDTNRRYGEEALRSLFLEIRARAGLKGEEHIKVSTLRHWRPLRLLQHGVEVEDIQQFTGHTSRDALLEYVGRLAMRQTHQERGPLPISRTAPVTRDKRYSRSTPNQGD